MYLYLYLSSGLFCLEIVCMAFPCHHLHLLLRSPIFITPSAFAAQSIFPFRICVAFVFLPHLYFWLDSGGKRAYICVCTGSSQPSQGTSVVRGHILILRGQHLFRPNNRKVTEQEVQKYKSYLIFVIFSPQALFLAKRLVSRQELSSTLSGCSRWVPLGLFGQNMPPGPLSM